MKAISLPYSPIPDRIRMELEVPLEKKTYVCIGLSNNNFLRSLVKI